MAEVNRFHWMQQVHEKNTYQLHRVPPLLPRVHDIIQGPPAVLNGTTPPKLIQSRSHMHRNRHRPS